jgi:hypothetical protein
MSSELDLGLDHWLHYFGFSPDRDLNPQYVDLPDNDKIGGIITHRKPDGKMCEASIWFDCPQTRRCLAHHPLWTVESWEPLTCSPSFVCHCGDHGFIRSGKWVPA